MGMKTHEFNGNKVTIYRKGVAGAIGKVEGKLLRIEDRTESSTGADVVFIRKGARKPEMVMSYYSAFWAVVPGWGNPDSDPLFGSPETSSSGCLVSQGRHRSCDPAWVTEFLTGPGKNLPIIAKYQDNVLTVSEGSK